MWGPAEVRPAEFKNNECERHVLPAGLFSVLGQAKLVSVNTGVALIPEAGIMLRSLIHGPIPRG